jgi:uncharacterized repeat protein (TIGR01451 family)
LPLPITLERGASIAASVIFTPADVGQRNGTLFIGDDGFLSPQTVSLTGTGVEIADVAVAQSVVASGEQLTYTLTVKNNGPGTATNVTLADSLPAQTKLISASNGCSKGGITCSLGSMARGAQAAVTVVVQVTSAGPATISNTAVVSSASPDSNTANNSATLRTNWSGPQ